MPERKRRVNVNKSSPAERIKKVKILMVNPDEEAIEISELSKMLYIVLAVKLSENIVFSHLAILD